MKFAEIWLDVVVLFLIGFNVFNFTPGADKLSPYRFTANYEAIGVVGNYVGKFYD